MRKLVLKMHAKVHILRGVHDNINELHASDHEVNVEIVLVGVASKVVHERLESKRLGVHVLEVIERTQHDRMTAIDETHGREQLEHERLGSVLFVLEGERNRVDRLLVTNDHVKTVLVIHDGTQATHTLVHVVGGLADAQSVHAFACVLLGS